MAEVGATRAVLYALVKDSPHTFRWVAEQIGERNDTLSTRLRHPEKRGYGTLDLAMVLAILDTIGVSFTEYARRVDAARLAECPEGGPHEWAWMYFQNLARGAQECGRCLATRTVHITGTEVDRG